MVGNFPFGKTKGGEGARRNGRTCMGGRNRNMVQWSFGQIFFIFLTFRFLFYHSTAPVLRRGTYPSHGKRRDTAL